MTNEQLLEDLKQFVNAKIDGVEIRLGERIDGVETRIDGVEQRLTTRMDTTDAKLDQAIELLDGVASMVEDMHTKQEGLIEKVDKHDIWIGRFKHKLA